MLKCSFQIINEKENRAGIFILLEEMKYFDEPVIFFNIIFLWCKD